jgi:hypothetical protein
MESRISPLSARLTSVDDDTARIATDNSLELRQRDTAQYISDMVLELRNMAKSVRLFQVMVPLEYAYYEAFSVANKVKVPREEIDRLKSLADAARQHEAGEQGA